jgi:preprotein translocase subunit YajC
MSNLYDAVTVVAQATGGTDLLRMLVPIVFLVGIFYFLLIAPQRKKQKQHQKMLSEIKKNDRVVTVGGIHGIVKSVAEREVVLTVDDSNKTKMTFSREAIARMIRSEEEEDEKQGS